MHTKKRKGGVAMTIRLLNILCLTGLAVSAVWDFIVVMPTLVASAGSTNQVTTMTWLPVVIGMCIVVIAQYLLHRLYGEDVDI